MSRSAIVRVVFVVHGVVTLAAGVVLAVAPGAIPASVGIALDARGALLSWFLAAAELALALLSFGAARLRDPHAIRLIALAFAVFHGVTAAFELCYAATVASGPLLVANIVVRVLAAAAFAVIAVRTGKEDGGIGG